MKQTIDSSLRNESQNWWEGLSNAKRAELINQYGFEDTDLIYQQETNPKAIIEVGDKIKFNEDSDVVTCVEISKDGKSLKSSGGHWYDVEGTILVEKGKAIIGSGVEEKFKVGAFCISGAVNTQYIESSKYGKQGICISTFYKDDSQPELEETAKLICEAVNNYFRLRDNNEELLKVLRMLDDYLSDGAVISGNGRTHEQIKSAINKAKSL